MNTSLGAHMIGPHMEMTGTSKTSVQVLLLPALTYLHVAIIVQLRRIHSSYSSRLHNDCNAKVGAGTLDKCSHNGKLPMQWIYVHVAISTDYYSAHTTVILLLRQVGSYN